MALYTDSPVFTIEELMAYETGVLDTAQREGINLTTKIHLAREEVGLELLSVLRRTPVPGGGTADLARVVVTAPLRLWQIFHTLAIVYRDAHHSQLNQRYRGKWQEYSALGRWAAGLLFQIGVGTVTNPIPEADAPVLSETAGSLATGVYSVQVAWTNAAGQEGAPSNLASIAIQGGGTLEVGVPQPPAGTTGWNVYVGATPSDLFQQNATALSPTQTWVAPGVSLASGKRPGTGQEPDTLRPMPRVTLRA
ncbi:MAG: hypothetical protein IPM24_24685 [Bryobacterales bacterium]|nr:hypothetical protein [Bryobacterales bacterium]